MEMYDNSMKPKDIKHPRFCNIDTGLCVIPVQFIDPVEITNVHLSDECL